MFAAALATVPLVASAQTPPAQTPGAQAPAPAKPAAQGQAAASTDEPSPFVPAVKNLVDVGFRGTTVDGDEAR